MYTCSSTVPVSMYQVGVCRADLKVPDPFILPSARSLQSAEVEFCTLEPGAHQNPEIPILLLQIELPEEPGEPGTRIV